MQKTCLFSLSAAVFLLWAGMAFAQDMKALPAPKVEVLPVEAPVHPGDSEGLVFLELYAAENCAFCPAAERNFNDIMTGKNVIGLTCMVGYFDSGTLSRLSRPFCKDQQNIYARMMKTGSLYTPQLVINGAMQVPGHNLQKVSQAIRQSRILPSRPQELVVQKGVDAGVYDVILPAIRMPDMEEDEKFILRLLMIRRTPDLAELAGQQKRDRTPQNVATALIEAGFWDGRRMVWPVVPPADEGVSDAFIVLVQDRDSGHILAAGQQDLLPTEN